VNGVKAGIAELCEAKEGRCLAAVAVGDWLMAQDIASGTEQPHQQQITNLSELTRQRWIRELLNWYVQPRWATGALAGLIDANAPQVDALVLEQLRGPPSGTLSTVLQLLLARRDPKWSPEVYKLFQRLNPVRDIPEPWAWRTAAEILLRTGYKSDEVCRSLLKANNRETGDTAILALEFAPQFARELFRRALRSTIPIDRCAAAAALAILDAPWAV
jgi:hypothetical protein